ncbi:MAG: phosphate ABC transporter substrate-binding/OmpA family protein [Terracidiphilus sp.]
MNKKICTNYGKCVLANTHEDFSHEKRSLTYCPLCDKKLSEVVTPSRDIVSKLVLAVSFTFILFVVVGFALEKKWINAPAAANAAEMNSAPTTILRLADSNSMPDSLAPVLAEAFLKAEGAKDVQIIFGANAQEEIIQGVLPGDGTPSAIEVSAHGPGSAFTALAENRCDIGIASQRSKSSDSKSSSDHSGTIEHVLGLDGIAVIVNPSNPLNELRKDTIKRIFAGEITDWSKLGSSHGAIQVYARDNQSGIFDSFKSQVLGGSQLARTAHIYEDSDELSQAVSGDPNAIGFISLPFIHTAKSVAISDKGTSALKPTRLTVATEDYPLSRRLYIYTPASSENAFIERFVDFATSAQGQEVVAANGFVAQNVMAAPEPVSKTAPDEYKQLTQDAERLSLDIRFNTSDPEKDSKAQADLDRVVAMVADEGGARSKILLFGFTDNTGSSEDSQTASLDRAKLVEKEFIQRGIRPAVVKGFGSDLPVASNDTADGREMNRRVEIWMKK